MDPSLRPIVAAIRGLIKEFAPQAQETISYGIPAYKVHGFIAVINPTKRDVTLGFSRGARFDDKYGLLKGVGRISKHVKMRSVADVNRAALRYYIKQALQLDRSSR